MKRPVTLLMLFIFLLNVLGYYGIFVGLQLENTQRVTKRLDDDQFSRGDAMTFRIPVSIPYSVDSKDYERVDGDFEYQGDVYRLVKQKLYRDTLYILCIKDGRSSSINQALTDYVKTFADKPANGKQEVKLFQNFSKDYLTDLIQVLHGHSGWMRDRIYNIHQPVVPYSVITSIDQPPRL